MISFIIVMISAFIWGLDFWGGLKRPLLVSPWPLGRPRHYFFIMTGRFFLFLFGMVAFFLFLKGMWQFEKVMPLHTNKENQRELYILLDTSKSMGAPDLSPSRLEAAKELISSLLEERSGLYIGIILFSEKVATLVPLTDDSVFLQKQIKGILQGDLGDGTNIGDSLALAIGKLKHSLSAHKSILLMTDGVSPLGSVSPTEATKWALEEGIQIHTVLLGRDKNLSLPGGSFDESLLIKMSDATGGHFYRSIDNDKQKIKDLLKKFRYNGWYIREDSYFIFFYAILILLVVETIRRFSLRDFL